MITMEKVPLRTSRWTLALAMLALVSPSVTDATELRSNNPLNPPAPIYWCPKRTPDQQYSTTQAPGCTPLVSEVDKQRAAEREIEGKLQPKTPIKIQNIQTEISNFVRQYRRFLDCCANDPASVDEVDQLQDQAYDLLKAIQDTGLLNAGNWTNQRQFTTSELIRPVVQASRDLHRLKMRLEQLGEAKDTLETLEYEPAARERRRIQQEEDAITKEFRPVRPPDSARTGMEAEHTTLPNSFGFDVGGKENPGGSSTTPSRVGPAAGDSSLNKR